MNHGDLIPGNAPEAGGRLAGVLDVGGLKPASDPTMSRLGRRTLERIPADG